MRRYAIGRTGSNDIALNDRSVSRHHADFESLGGGRYLLIDRNSANGTFVKQGGKFVRAAEAEVEASDRVRFGNYQTTVAALIEVVFDIPDDDSSELPTTRGKSPRPGRGREPKPGAGAGGNKQQPQIHIQVQQPPAVQAAPQQPAPAPQAPAPPVAQAPPPPPQPAHAQAPAGPAPNKKKMGEGAMVVIGFGVLLAIVIILVVVVVSVGN